METMIYLLTLRYLGHIERSKPGSMVRRTLHGHLTIKKGGAPWGKHHYKKAVARAIQAFQLNTMEGETDEDQPWVTACRDNSQQGKSTWAQIIKKGAEIHYTMWYNHRRVMSSAGGTRTEPVNARAGSTNAGERRETLSSSSASPGITDLIGTHLIAISSAPPTPLQIASRHPINHQRLSENKRKRQTPPPDSESRNARKKKRQQERNGASRIDQV